MSIFDCAQVYQSLLRKTFVITLEGGIVLSLRFNRDNFKHLTGLHKLTDISIIGETSAQRLFRRILKGEIPDSVISRSKSYRAIEKRIFYFYLIPSLLESKVIVDFDPRICEGETKLQHTDFIFFRHIDGGVIHLAISEDLNGYYPQTFFFDETNKYISEQNLLDVLNVEVVEANGEVTVTV